MSKPPPHDSGPAERSKNQTRLTPRLPRPVSSSSGVVPPHAISLRLSRSRAEVVARVGIRLTGLGVDVVDEVVPAPPVDEEDRVVARVDAGRLVVDQPLLDARRVDEVVVADLARAVLLVVGVLELGASGGLASPFSAVKNDVFQVGLVKVVA